MKRGSSDLLTPARRGKSQRGGGTGIRPLFLSARDLPTVRAAPGVSGKPLFLTHRLATLLSDQRFAEPGNCGMNECTVVHPCISELKYSEQFQDGQFSSDNKVFLSEICSLDIAKIRYHEN